MRRFVLILLLSVWAAPAHVHKPSDSYLTLSLQGDQLSGQWDIALRDLDFAIGLDAHANGEIIWGEVKAKHQEIAAYALARLVIAADGASCPILLKNSLSAMFDFLGGLWARYSKNQLGDQPICRLGSVRGPQPV